MGQFIKVLLAIDKVQTVPQGALECRPVLYMYHSNFMKAIVSDNIMKQR